jgi:hypothetical protein
VEEDAKTLTESAGTRLFLVKPNVGGRGAAITKHDVMDAASMASAPAALEAAMIADGLAVLQEYIQAADGCVHRVEMIGGSVVYRSRTTMPPDADGAEDYNNCASDVCSLGKRFKKQIFFDAPTDIPPEIVEECARIARAARMDIGSVEYVLHPEANRAMYFDINPVSTLAAGAKSVVALPPAAATIHHVHAQYIVDCAAQL